MVVAWLLAATAVALAVGRALARRDAAWEAARDTLAAPGDAAWETITSHPEEAP